MASFACPEFGCKSSFPTARGLSLHRHNCAYTQDDATLDSNSALALLNEKRAKKRQKLNPLEENPPAAGSTFAGPSGPANLTQVSYMDQDMDFVPEIPEIPDLGLAQTEALELSPLPPPPEVSASGRAVRKKRLTWKLLERMPEVPASLPEVIAEPLAAAETSTATERLPYVWKAVYTLQNSFGMYREYPSIPTHNPDDILTLENLSDITPPQVVTDAPVETNARLSLIVDEDQTPTPATTAPSYLPFANSTIFGLMNWMWSGSAMKSIGEMTKLITFLKSNEFKKEDLDSFDIRKETAKFDASLEDGAQLAEGLTGPLNSQTGPGVVKDGWQEVDVDIRVPTGQAYTSESDIPTFSVPGLHYRSIIQVIRAVYKDPASRCFHYTPFKQFWKPTPDSEPQRVYDEVYSSDAMVEAHEAVQNLPAVPGCTLERAVVPLMLWSDSTHLASFGNASLWPLYLFFGTQSKWLRGKPRTGSCHHIAYIPKLPDTFHDYFVDLTGNGPSEDLLTHLRRELVHAIWKLLLDDKLRVFYFVKILLNPWEK